MKKLNRYTVECLFNPDVEENDQKICLSEDVDKLEEQREVILIMKSGCVFGLNVPDNVHIEIRDYDICELSPEVKKDDEGKYYNPIYF